jgi:hypothetical protein
MIFSFSMTDEVNSRVRSMMVGLDKIISEFKSRKITDY